MQIGKVAVSPVFSCFALALCCLGLMAQQRIGVCGLLLEEMLHTHSGPKDFGASAAARRA